MSDMKVVAVAGAFDVKGKEYRFLIDELQRHGVGVLTIDFGVLADSAFPPDISSEEVAWSGGVPLSELRASRDKSIAMRTMTEGLRTIISRLHRDGRIDGACGMGGTCGTAVMSAAFRELPLGVPKLLISTVAGSDVSAYVGSHDITMMPSVADVAGINRISRQIFTNAAAAIAGMVAAEKARADADRPLIAASMFGNTTVCVDRARGILEANGLEVLTFHATGLGGRTMQTLASEHLLSGLLDVTTTELADEVCGGVFTAGVDRIRIGSYSPIPVVLAPGCVDMCNFGAPDTVPAKYRSRQLYEWNPQVTLMRTDVAENRIIGKLLAETANHCAGAAIALWPMRGVSMLDSPGNPFWNEESDRACYEAFKTFVRPGIPIVEIDANINDPDFADSAANRLIELLTKSQNRARAGAMMESR